MNADWMSLFLAALIGFSLAWAICSLWTARWLDRERRRMHEQHTMLIDPVLAEMSREIERLQMQEKLNRERA